MRLRDVSRMDWIANEKPTHEDIRTGALMRIADATETMAQEYNRLIRERDMYRRMYRQTNEKADWLARSNAALRGTITRMKRRWSERREGEG